MAELPPIEVGVVLKPQIGTFGPSDEEVLEWFMSVPVSTPANAVKLDIIRAAFQEVAQVILERVPSCPDRTAALRELAAASRTAVFAFTHNQET